MADDVTATGGAETGHEPAPCAPDRHEPAQPEAALHQPAQHEPVRHHRFRNTRVAKRARLFRARLNLYPRLRTAYKIVVGVVGIAVVIVGIIDIPLPGPGWLIVFLGLAILGTEFPLAHRFNMWVQRKLHEFWARFRAWRARRAAARSAG